MLINEIVYKVGLTRKSIRYYEEEGLLSPKRNKSNDYREYSEEDIKTLKRIKFLRELNVPIEEIKKLKKKEISLRECLQDRLKKISEEEKNIIKIKNMCKEIMDNNLEYDNLDVTKYVEEINILKKRGFTLKDMKKNNQKKVLGACLSSLIFGLFFLFFIVLFIYIKIIDNTFPTILCVLLVLLFIFPIIGIIVNLVKRIKEIKGGEEDEASKY